MERPSGARVGKPPSGVAKGRPPKQPHPQETARTGSTENDNHGPTCYEKVEGKRKGRPRVDVQELRSIPAHLVLQWREEFKRHSRVQCPCSGCWLEFPSIYGLKYHYQRCQGATEAERLRYPCPDCEAVFATKVRLHKHQLWNHPETAVTMETKSHHAKGHLTKGSSVKGNAKKRPLENSPPSPVFFKVKKTHEPSRPSQNGECTNTTTTTNNNNSNTAAPTNTANNTHTTTTHASLHKTDRKSSQQHTHHPYHHHHHHHQLQHGHTHEQLHTHTHQQQQQQTPQASSSDASPRTPGGSESEGGSLPPSCPEEDPERTRHRRKQKTPKKFTGEQPSISGTFGLKGMNKAEEKLKAGRSKRAEAGGTHNEDPSRKASASASNRRDPPYTPSTSRREAAHSTASSRRDSPASSTNQRQPPNSASASRREAPHTPSMNRREASHAATSTRRETPHAPGTSRREGPLPPATVSPSVEAQWHSTISEMGEVVCPTCSIVTRKTVPGLKKHMEICQKLQDALKCQQCHKQFRSKAGLNYHSMAEHSNKTSKYDSSLSASGGGGGADDGSQEERERLRRILKQIGKIKCPSEGCSAHFSSLMGYQYHQKRCGREVSDEDKPTYVCQHCGKTYRSKAGRDYHVRSEHPFTHTKASFPISQEELCLAGKKEVPHHLHGEVHRRPPTMARVRPRPEDPGREREETLMTTTTTTISTASTAGVPHSDSMMVTSATSVPAADAVEDFERTPSGRVRRRSAQVAVFHLQEIAEDELAKDWDTKRRIKDDLVPDSKRLNYTRPGLPAFDPEILETWKNQVKERGFICCPNGSCEAVYSSVSGLKAHLANCTQTGGTAGKYMCLLCQKEFSSESGVKYHISKTHSQNWFRATTHITPNVKKPPVAEPHSNGIKCEVKKGVTSGKKRGRKPKERPPEVNLSESLNTFPSSNAMTASPTQSPSQHQNSGPASSPSPAASPPSVQAFSVSPKPALVDRGSTGPNKDVPPVVRKRGKPRKVSLVE